MNHGSGGEPAQVTDWSEVTPVPVDATSQVNRALAMLKPLQHAWLEAAESDPDTFRETRLRILRSHAIETGIIERLYDVDWGVTEALVAEGLAMEVVQGKGTLEASTLAVINDQYDALQFVAEVAAGEQGLSVMFIRQLHQIITRHQPTYDATDSLGRPVQPILHHGEWKQQPNHVIRPGGSVLQYTPPDRVQDQIEALVSHYSAASAVHPVIRAAWLHHAFVRIHPFEDGNGRVGRALVLLELLRGRFAPLVVGRDVRETYLQAMDSANDGDLDPLVLLFAELERQAMVRQFQAPLRAEGLGVLEVARQASAKLADLRAAAGEKRSADLARTSSCIAVRVKEKLDVLAPELETTFKVNDSSARVRVNAAAPGDERDRWHHGQLIKLANLHDFYVNLSEGSWWTTIDMWLFREHMRFLVAVVRVGAGNTGVGAVVVGAERLMESQEEGQPRYEWLFEPTGRDQVPFTGELSAEEIWSDVDQLVDRSLAAAIAEFTRRLT